MSSLLGGFAGLGGGSVGRASVDLVLNAGAYDAQLAETEAKTKGSTASMGQGFAGFQQSVKSSFSGAQIAMVGFGAVAAGAIVKAVSATTEWASQVRALQRVTGQTAESASALAGAGSILGLDVTKLTTGFGLLEKNIVNASANLTKYGIATRDASGNVLPFDDVLAAVQEKFATLAPGAEQTAFAMNVFGRSGKDLIPILQRGTAGLAELEQKAKDAGLVMSGADLEAAKQLTIAQHELGDAFKGAAVQVGTQFLPVITRLVDDLTGLIELFNKVPGPVKAAALGFIALNGALVAVRGILGVASTVLKENAALFTSHTAAVERDAAAMQSNAAVEGEAAGATEVHTKTIEEEIVALQAANAAATENAGATLMAVGPMKLLNAGIVENIAGLAALAKGTQDAISEWDNFRAGNYAGALHDVTSELSFYTSGIVQTTPDLGAFFDGLQTVNNELKAGTITTQDATTQAQALADQYGVTLPQSETDFINAQTNATASTRRWGDSAKTAADAAQALAEDIKAATRAQEAARLAQLSAAGGVLGLVSSLKTLRQDQAAVNKLQDEGKTKTQAFADAAFQATQDTLSFRSAVRQWVADNPNRSISQTRDAIREMGIQAGLTGQQFRDTLGKQLSYVLGLMGDIQSKRISIQVDTSAVDAAAQKLHGLQQALARGL